MKAVMFSKQSIFPIVLFLFFHQKINCVEEPKFPGMVGVFPEQLVWIRDALKKRNADFKVGKAIDSSVPFKNRLILYGPPGNGKTSLIQKMAEVTGSKIFELDGPSVVKRHVGDGADNIDQVFAEAIAHVEAYKQTSIIFMDEIDALAEDSSLEWKAEHRATLQKLWLWLDKIKNNPNIVFACATNRFDKLNKTFLDRFGRNTFEIKNPDAALRNEVLQYYFKKYNRDDQYGSDVREMFNKQTEGLSIRAIEDSVEAIVSERNKLGRPLNINEATKTIEDIKVKFAQTNGLSSEEFNRKAQLLSLEMNSLALRLQREQSDRDVIVKCIQIASFFWK